MANKVKMAEWSYPRYDGSSIVLAPVRYVRHLGSPTNYDNQPVAMTTAPNIVIRPYVSKWVLLDECWFLVGTWIMESVVCPWWIMCWLDTTLTMFYYILVHICLMLLRTRVALVLFLALSKLVEHLADRSALRESEITSHDILRLDICIWEESLKKMTTLRKHLVFENLQNHLLK